MGFHISEIHIQNVSCLQGIFAGASHLLLEALSGLLLFLYLRCLMELVDSLRAVLVV